MLPDGPEQESRDQSMREAAKLGSGGWDEATFRHLWENIRILFAYDPEEDAEEWWHRWGLLRERSRGKFVMNTQGETHYESDSDDDEADYQYSLNMNTINTSSSFSVFVQSQED